MLPSLTKVELNAAENEALLIAFAQPIMKKYFEVLAHNILVDMAAIQVLDTDPGDTLAARAFSRGQLELLVELEKAADIAVKHVNPTN